MASIADSAPLPVACDPLQRNGNATRQKRHRERQRDAGMQLARVWLDFDTRQDLQEIAGRHGLSLEATIAWAIKDLGDRLLSRR